MAAGPVRLTARLKAPDWSSTAVRTSLGFAASLSRSGQWETWVWPLTALLAVISGPDT